MPNGLPQEAYFVLAFMGLSLLFVNYWATAKALHYMRHGGNLGRGILAIVLVWLVPFAGALACSPLTEFPKEPDTEPGVLQ